MNLSINWIKEFVNIDGIEPSELAEKLTLHTAEIEGYTEIGAFLKDIQIVKIKSVEEIEVGFLLLQIEGSTTVEVVCTDTSLSIGDIVCWAPPGIFIEEKEVTIKEIKNISSHGFLLSEEEMGISNVKDHVFRVGGKGDNLIGKSILKAYPFFHDFILKLDNKSVTHRPDLWGIYGFSREVAAIFEKELLPLPVHSLKNNLDNNLTCPKVSVIDTDNCFRYSAIVIDNVENIPSPIKLRTALHYAGVQSINLLVDLTNYVMIEVGQPTHVFSLDKVKNGIIVDTTEDEMPFDFLDGQSRTIPKGSLMIYDNDKNSVAVAGVMGGESSKVLESDSTILLESANFDASSVRITSNKLKLRTEASNRFEKSLVAENTTYAIKRFLSLLAGIQPNIKISNIEDVFAESKPLERIAINSKMVSKFIGIDISLSKIENILSRLKFPFEKEFDSILVSIPWFRSSKDLSNEPDIIEEIARMYGYDNIPPIPPSVSMKTVEKNPLIQTEYEVKKILSYIFDLNEVRTYGWFDNSWTKEIGYEPENTIFIKNPSNIKNDQLKTTLIPGLLSHVKTNMTKFSDIGIYEYGSVFFDNSNEGEEKKVLSGVLYSKIEKFQELFFKAKELFTYTFKRLKNRKLEFKKGSNNKNEPWIDQTNILSLFIDGEYFGYISNVHKTIKKKHYKNRSVVIFEFDIEKFSYLSEEPVQYIAPHSLPSSLLDFNILADQDQDYAKIISIIESFNDPLMMNISFVEFYSDSKMLPKKNSYLFSIRIGSKKETLNSSQIEDFHSRFISHLNENGLNLK